MMRCEKSRGRYKIIASYSQIYVGKKLKNAKPKFQEWSKILITVFSIISLENHCFEAF